MLNPTIFHHKKCLTSFWNFLLYIISFRMSNIIFQFFLSIFVYDFIQTLIKIESKQNVNKTQATKASKLCDLNIKLLYHGISYFFVVFLPLRKFQCSSNFCHQFPFSILRFKSSKWKSPKVKMFFHVFLFNFITSATLTRLFLMTIKCKRYAWVGKSQNNLTTSFYALQSSTSSFRL